MDLLTRLIAGSGNSPTKRQTNTPAERLTTCKSICNALTQTWRNGTVEREDESALIHTAKLLHRLESILHDESRRAAPHSCLKYVASSQAYIIITKLAVSARDVDIIAISAQLFHILINGEADGLLDSKLFTRSLLDLVCYATIGGRIIVEEKLETDLVELLFEIATKIRSDPDILPAWFFPERESTRGQNLADESRRSQFPLFYVLVQYVHHDGPVGDFSRTALLYLTETASKFKPLETWMIESDLAPQMASGLGALYSRLSRQTASSLGASLPIVALSDRPQNSASPATTPPDVQQEIKAFYSYLAFWQDTLNHCKSVEVGDTLLDHFQVLFVQQLLYPSLLESSDVDGGSTAAVISHLSRLLQSLDHYQLVDRILGYLLASTNMPQEPRDRNGRPKRMSVSRSKSMDHLRALAEVADAPSPNLFNLLDLMVISLKSTHVETVNACLKLLSVIISKHHFHVLLDLFRLEHKLASQQSRSGMEQFNNNLVQLFDYAVAISQSDDMDSSYQAILADEQVFLEHHSCLAFDVGQNDRGVRNLAIAGDCKLFEALLQLLQSFFANETTTNLSLTGTIISLAACEHMCLVGWLLPSERKQETEPEASLDVTSVIAKLIDQVRQWKSQFPDWDRLISARRIELSDDEPQSYSQQHIAIPPPQKDSFPPRHDSLSSTPTKTRPGPSTPRGRSAETPELGFTDGSLSMPGSFRSNFADRALGNSPLRTTLQRDSEGDSQLQLEIERRETEDAELLKTQLTISGSGAVPGASHLLTEVEGHQRPEIVRTSLGAGSAGIRTGLSASGGSGTSTPLGDDASYPRMQASLSHILTNAIILQEFILEIAAMVQLRATFFDEVDVEDRNQENA
ncbi:hypothetical protein B0A52_04098 [Exophiala mesophila]|uniref:FHF complex subunit HOOK-interacting protein C-terminal domain-containing protein n=1 Tax=Exophiala mesophila TaxID=212818 RepID=A0A438NA99_EXOME|nr:hypothetical protein B0A52_04098 [Exophiala mesophila]